MQLSRRVIWFIGLLAIYALSGIVILGINHHRATRALQLHALLEVCQTNWQEQFLQSQLLHNSQVRGLKAPDAERRFAGLQEEQAHRLHQLTRLTVGLSSDRISQGIEQLDGYDRQFRDALNDYIEAREDQLPSHNAKLVQLTNQLSELLEDLASAVRAPASRLPWIFWLWLLPILAAAAGGAWWLLNRQQRQLQTLQNYLDLPITQLLEPPKKHNGHRRFANFATDRELEAKLELLLQHIQEEVQGRENFTATMSHEIRTPMNGLIGFLSNLKETQLNDQQRQYLRIIDSSARSLMHVINEILDFTKLRAGRLNLEEIAFDLRAFADERTALARQAARGKSLKVHLNFPGEGPVIIRTDPSRLRQVLDNLLSNAVKFTDRGEVILEVAATPDTTTPNRLTLAFSVRDSGIGMTQAEQSRIFKPYTQADPSIARRYGGTGLGLYISYSLVELLGGHLQLQSRPGEGSTFSFSFTCDRAKPEEQVRFSDLYHVRLPRAELKKHWALLVDDTPTNLFLLETICQSVGLPYRTAENGRVALELCQQQHFDLIFMDIQMPIMDGYTAIREIRKLPDSATTVIVALTASAFQEDVEQALGAGSTGFIPKPFERDQLLLCIADALGITPERELRDAADDFPENPEAATIRRMHDFMREQYRLSLGEIKMILVQTLTDWRPLLDNLATYAAQGNAEATNTILHRLKGQLAAIGLLDHSEQTVAIMEAFRAGNTAKGQTMVVAFNQSLTRIFKSLEGDVTLPQ
ncbi:MAG: response regulator [Victivallales bacterium]|nr:response regulator [Victivallales bacterium]